MTFDGFRKSMPKPVRISEPNYVYTTYIPWAGLITWC